MPLRLARLLEVLGREPGRREGPHAKTLSSPHGLTSEANVLRERVENPGFTTLVIKADRRSVGSRREGPMEIVLNGRCCESLPTSMIEEVKENKKVWLIPKRGQVESLVEKNTIREGIWIVEIYDDSWIARIVVKDGDVVDVRIERGSAVYQGKAAIAIIDSLAGPVSLRVYRLKDAIMDGDPLGNFFISRRMKRFLKEVARIRSEIIDLVNATYRSMAEFGSKDLCTSLMRLCTSFEKLFNLEERILNKSSLSTTASLGHRFEHAMILRGLSEMTTLACSKGLEGEALLVKFLRIIDDVKLHFSQRDIEVYRIM